MKEKITNWLQRLNDEEAVPSNIVALNFGLFNSEKGYCIYLIGSEHYDETDDDWACDVDFEPKEKYLEITDADVQNMSWEKFQNDVVQIISDYICQTTVCDSSLFFNRVVTIGFDDGDLVRVK